MHRLQSWLFLLCVCSLSFSPVVAQDKAFLLNVGKGQKPNDTALEDKTVITVEESPELGGKALKIPLAAEDSFGMSNSAVPNWKKFARLRFDAFNPETETIELELNIVHSGSKNYQTRVVHAVQLKQGKNEITVELEGLKNVDGSDPDLAKVTKWYFGDVSKLEKTFFVGDIWLESGDAAATPAPTKSRTSPSAPDRSGNAPTVPLGQGPLVGYRVKGKVGSVEVDLTLSPFIVGAPVNSGEAPAADAPAEETSSTEAPEAGTPSSGSRFASKLKGKPAQVGKTRSTAKGPAITEPISFENPEADAIVSAMEIFPPDNAMKQDVSAWPVHANSENLIASMGVDKPLRCNTDMGYVLVPPNQEKIEVELGEAAEESDKGPYPVPENLPIELWPVSFQREKVEMSLEDLQRNVKNETEDRHAIVVDPANKLLYEFYQMQKTDNGWKAGGAAIFNLSSNKLRPDGWTSADAAGLPIFPLVVRHDELKRGAIEHALRVTVVNSRKAYVYPATHFASRKTDENLPRMGERIRLKKNYNISGHSPNVKTILKALQKYGMLVADNGIDWAISVTPDPRIAELQPELRKIKGSDFEVVEPPADYQQPTE